MASSKVNVKVDEFAVEKLAGELAIETMLSVEKPYKNILTGEAFDDNVNIADIINSYRAQLMSKKGGYIEVPKMSHHYPYINAEYQMKNIDVAQKLVEKEFRNFSQDEMSETDLKLQSVLMFRQYLRMIRRLLTLTYFHSHQDDEVTTYSDGHIHHKFFGADITSATAERIANAMYIPGFMYHAVNVHMRNIPPVT